MPSTLLEIGCGEGFFLDKISSLGIDVEGVDINAKAVREANSKGLNVQSLDVFNINKTYDMVVMFQVLEHMENPSNLLKYITSRLLRPEGYLLIAVPNPEGYLKELDSNLLDMPPHHNSCWSLDCFKHLTNLFGLSLIEYQKEPLRLVHYNGLIQHLIRSNSRMTSSNFKRKIFNKFQSLVLSILSPLTYINDRLHIDGQTHLILFKNDKHTK
jgi:SAM-dependent methyltransferase